jgi:glucose dehydrogenase
MIHKNKFLLALLIVSILGSYLLVKQRNKYLKERNQARSDLIKNQTTDPNNLKDREVYDLLFNKSSQIDFNSPNYEEKNSSVKREINVSQQMLDKSEDNSNDWIHPNGNYSQTRYYKNTNINIENIKKLKLAFTLTTGVRAQIESAPIIVNGIIYVSTSFNNIYAFDGKTGSLIWHYKYQNKLGDYFTYNCCGPNNRGLAIFKEKLFMGTLDGTLVCIDAKNGKLIWQVSLAKPGNGYSITAAPVVVNEKVIIGIGDGDFGVKGFLSAYNYKTGDLIWSFNTIPEKGQEGIWATSNVLGENLNRNIEKEKKDIKKLDIKKMGGAVCGSHHL